MRHIAKLIILINLIGCSDKNNQPRTYFGNFLERTTKDTTYYSTHFGIIVVENDSFSHVNLLSPYKAKKYPLEIDSFLYENKYWLLKTSTNKDSIWMIRTDNSNPCKISFVSKKIKGTEPNISDLEGRTIICTYKENPDVGFKITFLENQKVITNYIYENAEHAWFTDYYTQNVAQLLSATFQIQTPTAFMSIGFTINNDNQLQVEQLHYDDFEDNYEFDVSNLFDIKIEQPKDKKQIDSITKDLIGKWRLVSGNIKFDDFRPNESSFDSIEFHNWLNFQSNSQLLMKRQLVDKNEQYLDSSCYNWKIAPSGTYIIYSFERECCDTTIEISRVFPFYIDKNSNLVFQTSASENFGRITILKQEFKMKKTGPISKHKIWGGSVVCSSSLLAATFLSVLATQPVGWKENRSEKLYISCLQNVVWY